MFGSKDVQPMSAKRAASASITGMKPMRGKRSIGVRVRQSTRRAERALKYSTR